MKVLPLLILCFTTVALADDFKTLQGKEYKNVMVSRVDPDGIVLKSKSGISKVYFVGCRRMFSNVFITMRRSLLPIPHNKQSIAARWLPPVVANQLQ